MTHSRLIKYTMMSLIVSILVNVEDDLWILKP